MQWTSTTPGPRLLAALGLDGEEVRRDLDRDDRGPAGEAAPGLAYWVPTLLSRPPEELVAAPVRGRQDPLDPRHPVQATPMGRHRRTGRRRDRAPAVLEVPAAVRGARWEAGRPALVGLVVVVLCVASVLGLRIWSARAAAAPRDLAPGVAGQAVTAAAPAGVVARTKDAFVRPATSPTPATSPPAGARLRVHVVGRVRHPGVVVLPPGSRVEDAVRTAGGFTAGADPGAVNLARQVVDGEQVRIPAPGEVVAAPPATGGGGGTAGASGAGTGTGTGGKVDLNTADAGALDALPGVGEVLAGRILAWRQEHGRFSTVEELGEVSGIGDKLLEQLAPLVTL